jgi:hypothetical protein
MYFCDNSKCLNHIKVPEHVITEGRFKDMAGRKMQRFQIPKIGGSIFLCESCKNAVDMSKPWK